MKNPSVLRKKVTQECYKYMKVHWHIGNLNYCVRRKYKLLKNSYSAAY